MDLANTQPFAEWSKIRYPEQPSREVLNCFFLRNCDRVSQMSLSKCFFPASHLKDCPVEPVSHKTLLLCPLKVVMPSCRENVHLLFHVSIERNAGRTRLLQTTALRNSDPTVSFIIPFPICAAKIIKNAPSTVFHQYSFPIDNAVSAAAATEFVFANTFRPTSSNVQVFKPQNTAETIRQVNFFVPVRGGLDARTSLQRPTTDGQSWLIKPKHA